ncbi:hypothetical protein AB0M36_23580 [Actinoplanes sp. NPDC051346]|uniref:hypothetical protein n=1 Tax=Actinoplanes sp. NPDC051346 TaxID=3155048 RepID=UPI0034235696
MTEPFEQWEVRARLALADRGVGDHLATPIIADVKEHCAYSGESPAEAFGEPEDFAAVAAAEQSPEALEKVDRQGLTWTDYLSGQVFFLALLALVASLFFAVLERTLAFPTTPAILTGLALLTLGLFVTGALPGALRAAGRPELVRWCFVLAVVLAGASATAFMTLPRHEVARIPVLGIVAGAVLLIMVSLRQTKPKPAVSHTSPTPRGREAGPADVESWLKRLAGLLIGRFDLPPERAADLVREARAHLSASAADPEREFGAVDDYARRLAEHEPRRRDPWWRTAPAEMLTMAVGIAFGTDAFVGWRAEGHEWAAYLVAAPLTVLFAWNLARLIWRYLRERRSGSAAK